MTTATRRTKTLFAALAAGLLAGACATGGGYPGSPFPVSASGEQQCNPALAAALGGALGALIYEDNRTKGALIGAGLGALACAIINASSKPTQPPEQVQADYRAAHQGSLPEQVAVTGYQTVYGPEAGYGAGSEVRIVSDITVVGGSGEPVRELKEVVEILNPGDRREVLLRAEKLADVAQAGGGVQNTFQIRLPGTMKPGTYPVRNSLYVNGKLLEENLGTLRIVPARAA